MGLYPINCVKCGAEFVWFSGTTDQRCDKCRMTIKDHIRGNVKFQFYRDGQLYYKTEFTHLTFPVPISDIGNATFLVEDKGMFFMRYIRKFLEQPKDNVP